MILVAGGTGTLGGVLVSLLLARGERVRVLSRRADAAAPAGCELVVGDLRDAAATALAVDECSTVISAVHGFLGGRGHGPDEIDRDATIGLMDAAEAAGANRLVLLSVLGARPDHPTTLFRAKYAAEEHLRRSALDWTIIRPSSYFETWIEILGMKVADGGPAVVFGNGENPINFVSVHDVADVIAAALADNASIGTTIDVAGPQNVTMVQLAQALGAEEIKHVPRPMLWAMQYLARPVAPAFARQAQLGLLLDTDDVGATPSPSEPRPHRTLDDVLSARPPMNRGPRTPRP